LWHLRAETLLALKKGPAGFQQQQQQQLSDIVGIQDALWRVVVNEAKGDGRELLTSRDLIRKVSERE